MTDTITPENARTSPNQSHYAKVCAAQEEERRLEREVALRSPAPEFIAVYQHSTELQHRRCIYALFDPRTPDVVMYVGQTTRAPAKRLDDHVCDALKLIEHPNWIKPRRRTEWIASLLRVGLTPRLGVLQVAAEDEDIGALEQRWIRFYRFRGQATTNAASPGRTRVQTG